MLPSFRYFLVLFSAKTSSKIKTAKLKKKRLISKLPVSKESNTYKKVGVGGKGRGQRWWSWWWGWKMCCWGRQHPKCQSKQGCHRCADRSPDYWQAAAQTALSAVRAYHAAGSPAGLSLTGLHPFSSCKKKKKRGENNPNKLAPEALKGWQWHITTWRKNAKGRLFHWPIKVPCKYN